MDEFELDILLRQIDAVERNYQYVDLLDQLADETGLIPGCYIVKPAPTE